MFRFFMIPIVLFLCQSLAFAETLTLAAGAGCKRPLNEIIQAYEASGGAKIDRIYGNMGQIVMQAKARSAAGLLKDLPDTCYAILATRPSPEACLLGNLFDGPRQIPDCASQSLMEITHNSGRRNRRFVSEEARTPFVSNRTMFPRPLRCTRHRDGPVLPTCAARWSCRLQTLHKALPVCSRGRSDARLSQRGPSSRSDACSPAAQSRKFPFFVLGTQTRDAAGSSPCLLPSAPQGPISDWLPSCPCSVTALDETATEASNSAPLGGAPTNLRSALTTRALSARSVNQPALSTSRLSN